jgi:hypothetical protein
MNKQLDVNAAANLLGCHATLIRRFAQQGRIGEKFYGRWIFSKVELEKFDRDRVKHKRN